MDRISVLFVILAILFGFEALAKSYENGVLSFRLPDSWTCVHENSISVCKPFAEGGRQDAIIILATKDKGKGDTLDIYYEHMLGKTQSKFLRAPASVEVKCVRCGKNQINNHVWVDGLLLNSELKNYYTRYLATTTEDKGILVTFSALKESYAYHSLDFFQAVASLKLGGNKALAKNVHHRQSEIGILGPDDVGSDQAPRVKMMSTSTIDKWKALTYYAIFSMLVSLLYAILVRRRQRIR